MTFIPLGSQTYLLHRRVDIYGNSPNFSSVILNTDSESAVLGQCPGNWEHKEAEGSGQAVWFRDWQTWEDTAGIFSWI